MVTGNWVLRLFERIPNPPVLRHLPDQSFYLTFYLLELRLFLCHHGKAPSVEMLGGGCFAHFPRF